MRNLFLSLFLISSVVCSAQDTDINNFKPDNQKVKFTETNLPIVFIDTQHQVIERENRITAKMKIIDNGEGQLNHMDTLLYPNQTVDYSGYIDLKYRGNSSFTNSDKKPYAIRALDKPLEEGGKKQKVSLLGMGKDNDWALLAPYADKSMIRDVFAFTLARPFFEYVPTGKYCEMIMDGTYYGVFILSERVRKGKNRLDLPDPGDSGHALTGGYHLEVDRDDEPVYYSKHSPVDSKGNPIRNKKISFQYKNMDQDEFSKTQLDYIHGYIDAFEDNLASADYKNPETGYRKYIDVTSFIDYMLSTEFCHNVDGYRLSTNLYKYRDSKDPRFKTSLWDMNLGFGNADYNNGWRTDTWAYNFNDIASGDNQLVPFWWYKLLKDDAFMKEVKERWELYRETSYSDKNIELTIDSLTTLLNAKGAQERNSQAWPRWGRYVWPNQYVAQSYDDEISYLKSWIKERLIFMDRALLDKEPEPVEYTQLTVTSGFNEDVIAEQRPAVNYSTASLDNQGWIYYTSGVQEQGSLPTDRNITSSTGVQYRLAAYDKPNAATLIKENAATLQFDGSHQTEALYLLSTCTDGSSTVDVTVYYADETSSTPKSITIGDWYSEVSTGKAVHGLSRITRSNDQMDGRYNFCLYEHKINTDKNKVIASIKIENTGKGHPAIFAVTKEGKESGVGVENVSNEKQTKVYPRLIANGEVLTVESPANSTIRLMTMQGSVIMQQETTNSFTRLPINGLSQGIYLLTVVNASNQQTFKVIVK